MASACACSELIASRACGYYYGYGYWDDDCCSNLLWFAPVVEVAA